MEDSERRMRSRRLHSCGMCCLPVAGRRDNWEMDVNTMDWRDESGNGPTFHRPPNRGKEARHGGEGRVLQSMSSPPVAVHCRVDDVRERKSTEGGCGIMEMGGLRRKIHSWSQADPVHPFKHANTPLGTR